MKALATLLMLASVLAAALMGMIFLVTEDWRVQFAVFSLLGIVPTAVVAWRWLHQRRLKRRLVRQRLVGRTAVVCQPILQGCKGDVLVDGRVWVAAAQADLKRGDRVRIVGVDGVLLLVEPVAKQKPSAPQGAEGEV